MESPDQPIDEEPSTVEDIDSEETHAKSYQEENSFHFDENCSQNDDEGAEAFEESNHNEYSYICLVNCKGPIIINSQRTVIHHFHKSTGIRQTCHEPEDLDGRMTVEKDGSTDLKTSGISQPNHQDTNDVEKDSADEHAGSCTVQGSYHGVRADDDDGSYVQGLVFTKSLLLLKESHVVFLVGDAGEGKTATITALGKYYHQLQYKTVNIKTIDELEILSLNPEKVFAICENVFGDKYLSPERLNSWAILPSASVLAYLESGLLKLALGSSSHNWLNCHLGFQGNRLFQHPIFVTSDNLDVEEKNKLIESYMQNGGRELAANIRSTILLVQNPIAFPYTCKQLVKVDIDDLNSYTAPQITEVFQNPLAVANRQMQHLSQNAPLKFACFVILMLQEGYIRKSQLHVVLSKLHGDQFDEKIFSVDLFHSNMLSSSPKYTRVTITDDNDTEYRFSTVFIFEAVIYRFGTSNIREFLKLAPKGLILDRCFINECPKDISRTVNFVPIPEYVLDDFLHILTKEVIAGNAIQVFANSSIQDANGQRRWIDHLDKLPVQSQIVFSNSDFVKICASELECKLLSEYVLDRTPTRSRNHTLSQEIYSLAVREQNHLLSYLVHKGLDLNVCSDSSQTPCQLALVAGKVTALRILLHFGADVNRIESRKGTAPLHTAVKRDNEEMVDVLLQFSANVNCVDRNRISPLHLAAANGNRVIIELLVKAGADVNIEDRWGKTPLHYAADAREATVVSTLIHKGADVLSADCNNQLPIHYAALRKDPKIMYLLLQAHPEAHSKDAWGKTAKEYALENGSWDWIGLVDTTEAISEAWLL